MQPKNETFLIYVTFPNADTAKKIARTLVEERLLACANVVPQIVSIYRWEGGLCEDGEALMLGKTTGERIPELKRRLADLHEYDCPCLIAMPIDDGLPGFLQWVCAECSEDAG